ncbi:MAG: class I SAM-dependent methyltransferase [Candidatus Odinarchaeota archaeon]
MIWLLLLLLLAIGIILGLLIFIIITEGRYFGKRLIRWGYDRRSIAFEVRDDWQLWEHLIKRLKITSTEELLDLGTQTGHLPRLVARHREFQGRVVGIDWSEEMIQEARRQSRLEGTAKRIEFLCRDVQEPLPFTDNAFSLVTCVTGLLNGLKRPKMVFKEIQRVLKAKGRIAFRFEPQPLRPTPIRNLEWFTTRLEPLGFTYSEMIPWTPTHTILIFHRQEK